MKKNIVITGISSGIGYAIADHFLTKDDWQVFGIDIEHSKQFKNFFKGDICDERFIIDVSNKLPANINALINNAAIQIEKKFYETSTEEWKRLFDVNVFGTFLVSKVLLPKLVNGSAIINISSVHSKATSVGMAGYVASKSAISGLTRAMALELGERNIRVNSIIPGAIDTPMLMKGIKRSSLGENEALEKLKNHSPLKRIGSPKDVARLVDFLVCPELAANITGSEFVCDSGVLARLASE